MYFPYEKAYAIKIDKRHPVFILIDTKQHLNSAMKEVENFKKEAKTLINKALGRSSWEYLEDDIDTLIRRLVEKLGDKVVGVYSDAEFSDGVYRFGEYHKYYSDDIVEVNTYDLADKEFRDEIE